MIHKTKIDRWIAAVLIGIPGIMLLLSIIVFISADATAGFISLFSLIFVLVIYLLLVYPVYYETTVDFLIIRFGVIRYKINYSDINSVKPSRSLLSSPALSLDRLKIDHGKAMPTLISPVDKKIFLEDLLSYASHLKLQGDSLGTSSN